MARRAPVLLSVAILAFGLLALNQAFVAGPNQPALRGQEAAVAGAVLAALPAAPALATDQYTDSFSKVDAIVIFIPIIFVWIAFLEWDSKQPMSRAMATLESPLMAPVRTSLPTSAAALRTAKHTVLTKFSDWIVAKVCLKRDVQVLSFEGSDSIWE
eukprot:Skav213249  [mRNA]  locus=scaffold1311:31810:32280:+ [translate_table: standard]